jgi:hypothetical protein
MKEALIALGMFAAVLTLAVFFFSGRAVDLCEARWEGHETKWVGRCMVKIDGDWWPEDSIRKVLP